MRTSDEVKSIKVRRRSVALALIPVMLTLVCMTKTVIADDSSGGDDSGSDETEYALVVQARTLA